MPGAVRNDDATRVQYNVNSNADQRIYDSMHGEAMMLLHKEHVLAQALPDCIDDSAGSNNQVGVTQHLLTFISVPFFKIAFEVLDNHIGWAISAARLSKWFASLSNADVDWSPTSPTELRTRISDRVSAIPADELKLDFTDLCLISGALPNSNSDTFFDEVYGRQLVRKGDDGSLLAEAKLLMPCHYREQDRTADPFVEYINQTLSLLRQGTADLSDKAQAAEFVRMMRATRSPPGFEIYVEPEDAAEEIARRFAPTQAEQFAPTFEAVWRTKYPNLSKVLKQAISGTEARSIVITMLKSMDHGDSLVQSAVAALEPALNDYVAMLETPDYTDKSNAERAHAVRQAYKSASSKRASSDTKDDSLSSEASATLFGNSAFKELRQSAEACGNDDPVKMVATLLTHPHAAGVLFVRGKSINQEYWRQHTAVRSDAVLSAHFNAAVCYDYAGTARQDWGVIVTDSTIKKIMTGVYAHTDVWGMLSPIIEKQDGKFVADALDKDATAFWSDSRRLDLATSPWRRLFAAIGYSGREEGSAVWFMHHVKLMAHSIDSVPDSVPQKPGLKLRLQTLAETAVREFTSAWRTTLATPMDAAVRQAQFVSDGGQARTMIEAMLKRIARVREEVEEGLHGTSFDSDMNKLSGEKRATYDGYHNLPGEAGSKKPKTVSDSIWGSATQAYGMYMLGNTIAYHNNQVKLSTAPPLDKHCIACFVSGTARNKWCPTPAKCWRNKGSAAHARVDGFPDSTCLATPLPKDFDWAAATCIAKPRGSAPGEWSGAKGRGAGGKGAGGKGRGADRGSKGAGRGGKGGKGDYGKGGKGGSAFARQ